MWVRVPLWPLNKDGRQSYCKECARSHYKKWSEQSSHRKQRHAEWKKIRVKENRSKYVEYMSGKSCIDCDETEIIMLDFDHVKGDKVNGVLGMVGQGCTWENILIEIAKCEIRCVKCHRRQTAIRGNWWLLSV